MVDNRMPSSRNRCVIRANETLDVSKMCCAKSSPILDKKGENIGIK